MQIWDWIAGKTSAVGRLVVISALGGVLAAALVLPVVAATGILVRTTADKFSTLSIDASSLPQRSVIYDREGHLITYVYGVDLGPGMTYSGVDRQPVTYAQISPNMLAAIVAIEDDRFWQHGGLDIKGTLRALVNDLEHKPIQGGSDLEQQYVKNVLILQALDSPAAQQAATADTLARKLDQLRMAVQVAQSMSKQQIIAGYLNDSYYGSGAWGIEAAAETYFNTTAAKLTLVQAATLAGMVENPAKYDPMTNSNPAITAERRDTVLARLAQTDPSVLTPAAATVLESQKLVLHPGAVQSGCTANTVGNAAFFCDYVIHTILLDSKFGATTEDRAKLLATGGLNVYTTVAPQDQAAATRAVNFVLPARSNTYNPSKNADTEVLIQPGTGKVLAIAEDRPYGTGKGQTEVDYAVNSAYGGAEGVQTGSSSKLFTLLTALNQGVPFGFQLTVPGSDTVSGFYNCAGQPVGVDQTTGQVGVFPVVNSEGPGTGTYTLYTGTTGSINVFYAHLEAQVGLCNVVHTAIDLGMTRADGKSLLAWDGKKQPPADDLPTFTLGAVNVSPMSMAAAYATPASGGIYCKPIVLTKVTDSDGKSLPVPSAGCHRAISADVANAANYILQGVLTSGTGQGLELANYQAAGKTGTSNVTSGNGTPYAAFGGYTTALVGYVSVFNPVSPTKYTMAYNSACYDQEFNGLSCPNEMFGAMAPGQTWHMTFDHANLTGSTDFTVLSSSSPFWSKGDGTVAVQPAKKGGKGGKGGGNGNGNGGGGGTATPPVVLPTAP